MPKQNTRACSKFQSPTAKDAEDIIKKKRGTVLKCLKNLQNKDYIKKEGTGKPAYYIKTINDNSASEKNQPSIEATKEQIPSKPVLPPVKEITKNTPIKTSTDLPRTPTKQIKEKLKLKDLAQELGMQIKNLQKTCGKLNIDASSASTLLEINDIQKIQEYIQDHGNDQIKQVENESGVIIRRRNSNLTQPNENDTNKKSLSDE